MEHVVFFPAQDGSPAFRRVAGLDEAVRLVEHLRNVEGVAQASVHALTEVPLSFKAYYRVEVPSQVEQAYATSLEDVLPSQVDALAPDLAAGEGELVSAAARGDAAPGLGFFA